MSDPLPEVAASRLLIWRHGRTEWNASSRFQGQLDPPLDDRGREQAAVAAPHLIAYGLSAENTVVVSSDLERATQTAATLAALLGVPLRVDPRLREHGLGSWEGLTRNEVADRYPDQYADWLAGRPVQGRGGEEPAHVTARALAALVELPPSPNAVVVTHGGTAARLIEALLGLGSHHRRLFGPLANCSWSELVQRDGRWRLMRHNGFAPRTTPRPDSGANGHRTLETPPDSGAGPEEGAPATGDADAVL